MKMCLQLCIQILQILKMFYNVFFSNMTNNSTTYKDLAIKKTPCLTFARETLHHSLFPRQVADSFSSHHLKLLCSWISHHFCSFERICELRQTISFGWSCEIWSLFRLHSLRSSWRSNGRHICQQDRGCCTYPQPKVSWHQFSNRLKNK